MSGLDLDALAREIANETYPTGDVHLRNQLAERIRAALEQVQQASYADGMIAGCLSEQVRLAARMPRVHLDAVGTNGGKVTLDTKH